MHQAMLFKFTFTITINKQALVEHGLNTKIQL